MDSELIVRLRSCYDKVKAEEKPAGGIKVSRKDNLSAEKLLSQGDQFFSKGFFIDAIDKYNESLCYAQAAAENPFKLNEIYMKRAFALFRMDLPREGLESIRLSEDGPYPEHLRERLTKLTKRCEEKVKLLKNDDQFNNFYLQLTYPSHEKIPFMANCLELRSTEEQGRHIVTNRNLKVGDVVMIEEPIVSCLMASGRYKKCSNCMTGDKRHALVPCPSCSDAMYCSEECRKEAWDGSHRFECTILDKLEDGGTDYLVFRSLCLGVSICGGLTEFQKYLKDNQGVNPNAFDLDYNQKEKRLEFMALHNLHSDDSHLDSYNKDLFSLRAAKFTHYLVQGGVIAGEFSSDLVDFMLTTFYRYQNVTSLNSFSSAHVLDPAGGRVFTHMQLALSLINHSCAPNALRLRQGNQQQVLMVIRPIPKGGELSISYGSNYAMSPKEERQFMHGMKWGFKCKCEACEKDYPTCDGLQNKNLAGTETIARRYGKLGGIADRLEFAKILVQYLQKHDCSYPCAQLFNVHELLQTNYRTLLERDAWEEQEKKYKDMTRGLSQSDCARNLM